MRRAAYIAALVLLPLAGFGLVGVAESAGPCSKNPDHWKCQTTTGTTTAPTTTEPFPSGCTHAIREGDGQGVYSFFAGLPAGSVACVRGTVSGSPAIDLTSRITVQTEPGFPRATLRGYLYAKDSADGSIVQNLRLDGSSYGGITLKIFADDFQLLDSEVTNAHAGESCMNISNYSGSPSGPVYRVKILRNYIHACGQASNGAHDHGIYEAYGYGTEIADNTIEDVCCGWGIQLWTSAHDARIHHNLIRNVQGADAWSGSGVIFAGDRSNPSSGNIVELNIFTGMAHWFATHYWQGSPGTGNAFRFNCLGTSGSGDFADGGPVGYVAHDNIHATDCTGYGPR